MVGILLLMHEPLAAAFLAAVVRLFDGRLERIEAIDVQVDQDVDDISTVARKTIARLDGGAGVLVLTDVFGGTPSNCCGRLCEDPRVQVVTGTSLPMLLRAITYRENDLETVIEKALAGGRNGAIRIDSY